MQKKTSKTKMFVNVIIGVLVLAMIVAAAVYLPDLMRQLHGG